MPDLKEVVVELPEHLMDLILIGNQRRKMASTNSNQFSSWSHAVLQINVEAKIFDKGVLQSVTSSKLSLIDLAGSEWAAIAHNTG